MKYDIKTFAEKTGRLPSLPPIYYELNKALEHLDSSVEDISGIIRKDPGLASSLLKLANSVFYGFPAEIGSLDDAVQLIGLREIHELVLATSVIEAFEGVSADLADVPSFWAHSISCGIASALLAEQRNHPLPERLFVGGLLHDIGRLVMFLNGPEESREVLERCQSEGELVLKVEKAVFGFDHATLGAELVHLWNLPNSLVQMVGCHHGPSKLPNVAVESFLVHYADFITSALEFGYSGELYVAPLVVTPKSQSYLLEAGGLDLLINELDKQCEVVFPILLESGQAPPQPEQASPQTAGSTSPPAASGK